MEDVRHIAEERAARPRQNPVGAGFESERKQAKNALIKQIDALDGSKVRKIAAAGDTPEDDRALLLKLRTAKPSPPVCLLLV